MKNEAKLGMGNVWERAAARPYLLTLAILYFCTVSGFSQAQPNLLPPLNPGADAKAELTVAAPPDLTNVVGQLPGPWGKLGGDLLAALTDAQPYFTNGLRYEIGALYSNGKVGALLDFQYPVTANGQVSVGFALAYLDGTFYDASIGANIGKTITLPLIGSVYTWVESGPGYNFKLHQVMAQSFAGVSKQWMIGSHPLVLSAGVGNISDRPGPAYFGGVSIR